MSLPKLNQLTRAEQLFDDGKLDEALEILNDPSQYEGLDIQQKSYFQFLKGLILFYFNRGDDLISLGETMYNEGENCHDNLQTFDGFYFIITGLALAGKYKEVFKLFDKAELLLKDMSNVSKEIITQRKARLSVTKAFVGLRGGKVDWVEKSLMWILDSQEKFEKSFEIPWANLLMASYFFRVKTNFDLTREHIKKALSFAKEIKFNHYWIALCHLYFGGYYSSIGEMDKSLKYNIKSLELFKKIKSTFNVAILLGNMGEMYRERGEYKLAVEHLEESLYLLQQLPQGFVSIEAVIGSLVSLAVEYGDKERTKKYFDWLEDIYNRKKGIGIELHYKFAKALILKKSSRIRDKAKAEELLKEIIETDTIIFDLIILAHIHLCEILLVEYRIDNDSEILAELNHYISKLLTIAEKEHSFSVFCETFMLQAKLALLNFDIKAARLFLTQAQKTAESYNMKRLAMKISHEHDHLLKQLKLWENLKESEAPLAERWKLAGLSNQMENIERKRAINILNLSDEKPILLLILSEGGRALLSHSFIETSIDSQIFGGFLTTIDYFIKEMFSEGLDRAVFGEYTLVMKSITPFYISYIFKGDSYYALQKTDYFVNHIKKEEDIWQNLLKSFEVSKAIHLEDIPLLESLIKGTFTTKSLVQNSLI